MVHTKAYMLSASLYTHVDYRIYMHCVCYGLSVKCTVHYIIDVLNNIKSGDIQLTLSDANTSVIIEETNNTWGSVFVVMPMRL